MLRLMVFIGIKLSAKFISTAVILCNVPSEEINKSTRDIAHIVFKITVHFMHSSRMRTDRLLTVCLLIGGMHTLEGVHALEGGCIHWREVHPLDGVHPLEGVHPEGASRGVASWKHPPPVNRMTHTCENITFPHTPYAVGKDYALSPFTLVLMIGLESRR